MNLHTVLSVLQSTQFYNGEDLVLCLYMYQGNFNHVLGLSINTILLSMHFRKYQDAVSPDRRIPARVVLRTENDLKLAAYFTRRAAKSSTHASTLPPPLLLQLFALQKSNSETVFEHLWAQQPVITGNTETTVRFGWKWYHSCLWHGLYIKSLTTNNSKRPIKCCLFKPKIYFALKQIS